MRLRKGALLKSSNRLAKRNIREAVGFIGARVKLQPSGVRAITCSAGLIRKRRNTLLDRRR